MPYTDFKNIAQAQQAFQIKYTEANFIKYISLTPSKQFMEEWIFNENNIDMFSSEASRCENVIYPVLREVYKHFSDKYALWSHRSLHYDNVLCGTPDYLFTTKSELGKTVLGLPILIAVEAKQNNFAAG